MIRFSNPDGFIFICRECHHGVYVPKQHYYKCGDICENCANIDVRIRQNVIDPEHVKKIIYDKI